MGSAIHPTKFIGNNSYLPIVCINLATNYKIFQRVYISLPKCSLSRADEEFSPTHWLMPDLILFSPDDWVLSLAIQPTALWKGYRHSYCQAYFTTLKVTESSKYLQLCKWIPVAIHQANSRKFMIRRYQGTSSWIIWQKQLVPERGHKKRHQEWPWSILVAELSHRLSWLAIVAGAVAIPVISPRSTFCFMNSMKTSFCSDSLTALPLFKKCLYFRLISFFFFLCVCLCFRIYPFKLYLLLQL